ncbi:MULTISPECIES: HNH endonuclease family protein [Streptomyces]|uniref:HNH endonuclease n=3 Tax=Streptomyces TaxID=1883 RepID=A0A3Q9FVE6_STRLT|nr:HNH endonuclease family protein [Streptomyces luteoverticillatus]AZQ70107.1 HNH endonuclease [Streptomyces luteoverticillatus]
MRLRQGRVAALVVAVCAVGATLAGCGGKSGDAAASSGSPSRPAGASSAASKAPAPSGEGKNRAGDPLPGLPTTGEARKQLAALKAEKPHSMSGYSRAKFPHWAQQGNKCDTRETVLERDGKGVKRDGECRAVEGTWHSLYDDKTADKAGQVDIDHIVPLANAWRSGADKWDDDRRKAFANDLTHPQLLTVSAASNRSKGDQSPDQWQPPAKSAWCFYGRGWTSVKSTYGLSVTEEERGMLTKMLDTCTS